MIVTSHGDNSPNQLSSMPARFPIPAHKSGNKNRAASLGVGAVIIMVMVVASLGLPGLPVGAADDESEPLPELGDSATLILSPAQEKRIGQQFLRQLIRDKDYIGDPELNAYLNRLGARVAQNASLRGTPITAHLLQDPDLNAFAVPGGHITFHTGLILTAEDESELASVMGHEIAHISQRHLPRMLAKSEASKLPVAAAILAAVLVGGKAGLAGLTVANAALLSNQLAYTRDFEREADSIGIKLLAEADFNPAAMARFFSKIDRHGGLGDEAPEFLRTHPLSYTRIAEAENRAAAYPVKTYPASRAFRLAKAKIRALYSPRDRDAPTYFKDLAARASGEAKIAAIYGLALALRKLRQFEQARTTLQPLLDAHPDEVAFQLARAEIDVAAGNPTAAAARYEKLTEAHPQSVYLVHYQARALIAGGDASGAKRVVRHQLRRHKDRFVLYPLLAESNAKLGLLTEARQATAEFHAALGEYRAATASLKQALRENDSEGYLHQSITARLGELEEILEQQPR